MSDEQKNTTIQHTAEKEPSSFKLVFTLGIAGLLSGIILVGTFIYTKPLIQANKKAATQRAIFKVLPDCTTYSTLVLKDSQLALKATDENKKEEADKDELLIYAGFNAEEELIGFAIPGSEPGFQDVIGALFGYDAINKIIIGFEVLESKETPGLGDKIFKDADFQTNFKALAVAPEIIAVKPGMKQNPNEVETITGATISSKAIVRLLNETMDIWEATLDVYIKDNELKVSDKNE
ncbi:MAG: FMN-binding protein [Bacteroidetes bacterium]|nr:MAG: FMN-binding protein [Bacteroidota bacterium]